MNSSRTRELAEIFAVAVSCMAASITTGFTTTAPLAASHGPLLWDTGVPSGDTLTSENASNWQAVPSDLLLLEADPMKARSDPGFYGREYSFRGDAVVETPTTTVLFRSVKGCLTFYSKQGAFGTNAPQEPGEWKKIVDVMPLLSGAGPVSMNKTQVLRNSGDTVVLEVSFAQPASPQVDAVFSFDKTGVVEIKPGGDMKRVRLSGSICYGVVPAFIGDDLIFGGPERGTNNTVTIPSENLFLGLMEGESTELVMTWPKGKQRMSLGFGEQANENTMSSVDFENAGQSFYLSVLSAPGIWHKETLTPEHLEKDSAIQWRSPFAARWKTLLFEEELKTTFAFRESKGQIWRGVAGSYQYPVWFEGDRPCYHLSKKIQPKGESIIYCLEGRDTPACVQTPADLLKQTLGRQAAESILDYAGRKLRTHHRRGGEGVRRACTCGCTEAIQAVFEAGEEVSQKDYIQGALEDMIYFVHRHVERINEYQRFAEQVLKKVQTNRGASPNLRPFLDNIEEIARQIPQECEVQKENMKTFAYADELSKKTMALTGKKDPENLKAYMELLKAWRDMGGAQDFVVAKCHTVTRSLCQAAGYGCAALPEAVPLAEEIRAACRETLRNADGYEIWADY